MTKTATILRFQPNGPDGLEEWEQMDYASLVSGQPVQHGHLYHEIESSGYMAGVWDCTAFTDQMMPYTVDEYMLFLDGELTMVLPDGTEIEIRKGDAFIIPKGFECQWKQPGFVQKIFMILDGPVPKADNTSLQRITVPDLSAPDAAPDVVSTRTDFVNAAGTMRVDVQNFGALSQPALRLDAYKIITVLDGTLSLHDGAETHSFAKGETAYVHQGDTVGCTTEPGTRLIVASYADPG
ncbi:cupin domain-containing protein [Roseovarius sp.]|uniref:cupin domain-containing protein n=1 Tax=Roseovarius sp. TaxID=1486281 RepID=UPI003D117606